MTDSNKLFFEATQFCGLLGNDGKLEHQGLFFFFFKENLVFINTAFKVFFLCVVVVIIFPL